MTDFDPDGHACAANDGLCQGLNAGWNALHEIANGTQHNLNDAIWSAKNVVKTSKKALDTFNSSLGFGSTNCSGGGSCAGGVASAAGAIIAGVESGGESEEGPIAKAFSEAESGGRHAGFRRNYLGRSIPELEKGIGSLEKEIAEHEGKLANPSSIVSDWAQRGERYQQGLLRKWRNDIARQTEQREILQELLKRGQQ
jgi:hypothetical protein